jgi:hypothetical protein
MKKVIMSSAMLLLVAALSVQAQQAGGRTSGNSGQQGSSPQNNARKANTSQTAGKGVPYTKEAEQKGRSTSASAGVANNKSVSPTGNSGGTSSSGSGTSGGGTTSGVTSTSSTSPKGQQPGNSSASGRTQPKQGVKADRQSSVKSTGGTDSQPPAVKKKSSGK